MLLAGAFVLALTGAARADDAAQARFHDERARAHYEAGRYEEALEEFFLEQRLAPNPRTVFNIALSFDRLHREEEAFLFFQEYLASDDADEERRTFVAQALARLEPRLARVRITSDPAGATVYVDDRDHGAYGATPRVLALSAGAHHVIVELEGHRVAEADVTLVRGEEVAVALSLARIEGRLVVTTPAAGTVTVRDGTGAIVAEGPAPLESALPPGTFSVETDVAGHRPWREVVRVEADVTRTLVASPEELPPPTGEITVTASVPGAVVEVDGEPRGFAPTVLADVATGEHRVTLRSEGLDPWEGTVAVEPDVRSWLTVSLVRPAETTRSEATWIVGGGGVVALIAWATLVGFSVSTRDDFDRFRSWNDDMDPETPGMDINALRRQGEALEIASDVTLGVAIAGLGGAVLLYFLTEHTETAESSAAVAREER